MDNKQAKTRRNCPAVAAGLHWIIGFSLLLGLALSFTMEIHYSGNIRGGMAENYISLSWISILRGIGFAVPLSGIVLALSASCRFRFTKVTRCKLSDRGFFLLVWGLLILSWLPYLITFFPGGLVGDGAEALEYALDPSRMDTRWSAAFILVLRGFLALGRLFSPDVNVAVFLYALCSTLLYSAACARVVSFLRKRGLPPVFQILCVFVYAVSGHYASYAMGLWKDGLFAAGGVMLALQLWDAPEYGPLPRPWAVKTGVFLVFLCFWRNSVSLAVTAIGLLTLLFSRNRRNLAILLLVIGIVMTLICGPGYTLFGFQGTGAAESIALPIQQTAAALSEGAELTEWQHSVLSSLLPVEKWIAGYTPAISDSLKNQFDDAVVRKQMVNFLRVWLQLMPKHAGTYFQAHLMETLGFWQVYGSNKGPYFDWFLGVQDLYDRGYEGRDFLYESTGYTLAPSLLRRTAFIPSGTLGWILLLSFTLVMLQKEDRRKKAAVLLPFLACWAAVLFVTPIAYSYRYVEILALGLPVIVFLPWIRATEKEPLPEDCIKPKKAPGSPWIHRITGVLAVLTALILLFTGLRQMNRFTNGQLVIPVCGENDDSAYFVTRGLYDNEGAYRWTAGTELEVHIPYRESRKNLTVFIHILGVFNGIQPYLVTNEKGVLLAEGAVNTPGDLTFSLQADPNEIAFTLQMPEAAVISDVVPGSEDPRRVAFQIDRIVITQDSP